MVLIPHPTEELKLIKFQKKLISELNVAPSIYVSHLPLWIDIPNTNIVPETKDDLKTFSKTINSVEFVDFTQDDKGLSIKVTINTTTGKIFADLPILHLYKGPAKNLPQNIELPFKKIKIFRLGIPEDLSTNSKAIKDFVWCKL